MIVLCEEQSKRLLIILFDIAVQDDNTWRSHSRTGNHVYQQYQHLNESIAIIISSTRTWTLFTSCEGPSWQAWGVKLS